MKDKENGHKRERATKTEYALKDAQLRQYASTIKGTATEPGNVDHHADINGTAGYR